MRARFVLTVLALMALVASCGQGQDPAALIAAVPDQVDEAGSSRFSMDVRMESPDLPGGSATMTAEGEARYEPPLMQMTMDMGSLVPGGGSMEMILDDTVMYMRLPQLEQMLPAGKSWVSIDLEETGEQLGIDLSQLMRSGANDPSQSLEMLRGVSEGEIEELGTEEIGGEQTTHYRAAVDMERAIDRMPEDAREQFRALMADAGMPNEIPVEIWVDAEGLPRRYLQSIDVTVPQTGSVLTQTITMEFFEYGIDVEVEPPPAEETVDARELSPTGTA